MTRNKSYALLFILLLSVSAFAQNPDKVDAFVLAEMQKKNIPAVSIAVVRNGKVEKMKGYGMANVELNVPATTETVYKIGSVSKPIIAVGIMMLVEEGKLSLDDPVSKHLDGTPETWKAITVRHFLAHTSGVIRESPAFDGSVKPDIDVIKAAYTAPLVFATGEKYQYCNVGYFALAEIISRVGGKPWPEFLADRIFKPLGMTSTRTTTTTDIVQNRANGYSFSNGKLHNSSVYNALRPSGAFLSTVGDLVKFEAALNAGKLLKADSLKTMWTRFKFNDGKESGYALGWTMNEINGHKVIGHGGSLSGFRSEFAMLPDDKMTVIVLTNLNENVPAEIVRGVATIYIPELAPRMPAPAPVN